MAVVLRPVPSLVRSRVSVLYPIVGSLSSVPRHAVGLLGFLFPGCVILSTVKTITRSKTYFERLFLYKYIDKNKTLHIILQNCTFNNNTLSGDAWNLLTLYFVPFIFMQRDQNILWKTIFHRRVWSRKKVNLKKSRKKEKINTTKKIDHNYTKRWCFLVATNTSFTIPTVSSL